MCAKIIRFDQSISVSWPHYWAMRYVYVYCKVQMKKFGVKQKKTAQSKVYL